MRVKGSGRRIVTWLCTVGLMLGLTSPGSAAAQVGQMAPEVAITCVKVMSNGTLELGLNVEAQAFKSVGAVVKFDHTKLELLDWSSMEPYTVLTVPQGASSWDTACTLNAARGSDETAAKPCLAYRDGTETYLYLSGGLFTYQRVNRRVVTVRFQYKNDDEAKSGLEGLTDKELGPSGTLLSLAGTEQAAGVMAGRVQCTVAGDPAEQIYVYGGGKNSPYPALEEMKWAAPRKGVGEAGAENAQTVGVTFLDWDGTVLDTAALPLLDDVTPYVETLIAAPGGRMQAALAEGQKKGYRLEHWLDYKKLTALQEPPLTANNDGLDLEQYGALTVDLTDFYGYVSANCPTEAEGARPAVVLQACFRAKEDGAGGYADDFIPLGMGGANYWINDGPPETGGIYFTRYGYASQNVGRYAIRVQIDRVKEDGSAGVERIREPGLVIHMRTKDGQDLYSFQATANQEIIQAEITPTREMEWVEFYLADTYGFSAWPNAASRTGAGRRIDMADVIRYGTANYIMEQAYLKLLGSEESEWDRYVDDQAFLDATGTGVWDLEETKRVFLAWMAEVYFPETTPVQLRESTGPTLNGTERELPDDPVPMAALPAASWLPPSYEDFLEAYDRLGVDVSFTVCSNDPKKELTCELYQWDVDAGSFGTPINEDLHPVEHWSPAAEQAQGWKGNGEGTGEYEQTFTLPGLQRGVYQLRVSKLGHTAMVASFEVLYTRSQIAESGLPEQESGGKLPIALSEFVVTGEKRGSAALLLAGDVDGDRYITVSDWTQITSSGIWGQQLRQEDDPLSIYDLNGDLRIDITDVGIVLEYLGRGENQVKITLP